MSRALGLLFLIALLFPACDYEDIVPPGLTVIFPAEVDTLVPNAYELKVVASDDHEMQWIEFWEGGWLLGLVSRSDNDTFRLGWDCRNDLRVNYYFTFHAVDEQFNYTTLNSSVTVRR